MLRLNSQYARNHLASSPSRPSRNEPRPREEYTRGYSRDQPYQPAAPTRPSHTRGKTYNYDDAVYQPRSNDIASNNEPERRRYAGGEVEEIGNELAAIRGRWKERQEKPIQWSRPQVGKERGAESYAAYRQQKEGGAERDGGLHVRRNEEVRSRIGKDFGAEQPVLSAREEYVPTRYGKAEQQQARSTQAIPDYAREEGSEWVKQRQNIRPQLNRNASRDTFMQRVESTQLSQNTPQRRELGSAERKQELIEKSQRLQDKLRKLNGGEPVREFTITPREREKEGYNTSRELREREPVSRSPLGQENVMAPRRTSYNRLAFNPVTKLAPASLSRQLEPSSQGALNEAGPANTSQALAKINDLNEKINSRIQSIIQNYSK